MKTIAILNKQSFVNFGKEILASEGNAILNMLDKLDANFINACDLIYNTQGKIIVTGMGKSGHIAKKFAATLASTGTPAFFIHPSEALHGDLGMIESNDTLFMLSYSGNTDEIVHIGKTVQNNSIKTISITNNPESKIAKLSDVHINLGLEKEACPLNLAPTTSTTLTLALCDAVALAVAMHKDFSVEKFAASHPGGSLGKKYYVKIKDIMHKDQDLPIVTTDCNLKEAIIVMSSKKLGFINVIEATTNKVVGVFSDGDLRRSIQSEEFDIEAPITKFMQQSFSSITDNELAYSALKLMKAKKINAMPVVDNNGCLIGCFNVHDIMQNGIL